MKLSAWRKQSINGTERWSWWVVMGVFVLANSPDCVARVSPATLMGPPFRHEHGTTSSPFVPADRDAGGPGTAVSTGGLLACPSWLGFGRPRRRLWLLPLAVGLAFDDKFVGRALDPVDGGLGEQRVSHLGQELTRIPVRCDDGRPVAMAFDHQLVEVIRLGDIERVKGKIIGIGSEPW